MLRRVLVLGAPLGTSMSAVAVVKKEEQKDETKKEQNLKLKPSDLPIYTSLVDDRWLLSIEFIFNLC
jgi:hypothetical protein